MGRSRAELVRRLRFLPLSRDLRQEFQYCNLGYLVASWPKRQRSELDGISVMRFQTLFAFRQHVSASK